MLENNVGEHSENLSKDDGKHFENVAKDHSENSGNVASGQRSEGPLPGSAAIFSGDYYRGQFTSALHSL